MQRVCLILLSVALGSSVCLSPAAAASFTFTTLDVPGAAFTEPVDINNRGQIIGSFDDASGRHGFLLTDSEFTTIDAPGTDFTMPRGINDSGDIVGDFGLLRGGTFTDIDLDGGFVEASGINNAGQIAGTVGFFDPEIPEVDFIFGFVLDPGGQTTFLALGGSSGNFTQAFGINDRSEVVGWTDGGLGAYLFSGNNVVPLDVPGTPYGINNTGQIVGTVFDDSGRHGFLLSGGTVTRIDAPGNSLTEVRGINDAGQIVGTFFDSDLHQHGFVATPVPVPEPGTFVLLGTAGLALLGQASRRRRH